MKKIVCRRNFKKKTKADLGEFGQHIHDSVLANGAWPAIAISETALQNRVTDYITAAGQTEGGSTGDTAAYKASRAILLGSLDTVADWVDGQANGDPAIIISMGFEPTAGVHHKTVLVTPTIKSVINLASTKLKLIVPAVSGARTYEAQIKVGDGPWVDKPGWTSTRKMVLSELETGATYQIRLRVHAGEENYSEWSAIATATCT